MLPFKSLLRGVHALQVNKLWQNTGNVQCASYARKTLNDMAGLPPKPKKPLTPYFRFMQEQRPQILSQNPKFSVMDVVKMVAKSWEKVDDATRQRLEKEYKREKEEFDKEILKYESKLTPQQKEDLKTVRHEKQVRKERLTMKKRNKDLGKPKKPLSSFLLFIADQRASNPKTDKETVGMYLKRLGEKWATLSDAQKKPYADASAKASAEYKVTLEKWENKMIKEGNLDVIRNPLLLEPVKTKTGKESSPKSRKQ